MSSDDSIPMPKYRGEESDGITLSSSSRASSSVDSSYKSGQSVESGPSKSGEESPLPDSVHSSDALQESDPSDGVSAKELGQNPHAQAFNKDNLGVLYHMTMEAVRSFYSQTSNGYVGIRYKPDGAADEVEITDVRPEPEGVWSGPKEVLKNPALVEDMLEYMAEIAELCFVDPEYQVDKPKKPKYKTVKSVYNSKEAIAMRKKLSELRSLQARELKLRRKRDKLLSSSKGKDAEPEEKNSSDDEEVQV